MPVGFGAHGLPEDPVIGCGYQATYYGAAALGAAEDLALALGGSLQVMHVVEPPSNIYDTGEMPLNLPELDARIRAHADRALERARRPPERKAPSRGGHEPGRKAC